MPIEVLPPGVWVGGGVAGSVVVMLTVRFLLKQYGEIPVDQKKARAEGAIHDAYRELIASLRSEISRLHDEVTRIKSAVEACEQKHHERDRKDDQRSIEIQTLTRELRQRGVL